MGGQQTNMLSAKLILIALAVVPVAHAAMGAEASSKSYELPDGNAIIIKGSPAVPVAQVSPAVLKQPPTPIVRNADPAAAFDPAPIVVKQPPTPIVRNADP